MKLIVEACVYTDILPPHLSLILAYFLACLLAGEGRVSGPLIQRGPSLRAAPGKTLSMEGDGEEASISPLSLVISAPLLTSCGPLSSPSCLSSLHMQMPHPGSQFQGPLLQEGFCNPLADLSIPVLSSGLPEGYVHLDPSSLLEGGMQLP